MAGGTSASDDQYFVTHRAAILVVGIVLREVDEVMEPGGEETRAAEEELSGADSIL